MSQFPTGVLVSCLFPFFHSFIYFSYFPFSPSAPKQAWRKNWVCSGETIFHYHSVLFNWPVSDMMHCTSLTHCDPAYTWQNVHTEKAHEHQRCDENAMRTLSEKDAAILCERLIKRVASRRSTRKRGTSECFHGNHIDYFISLLSFFIATRVPSVRHRTYTGSQINRCKTMTFNLEIIKHV